MRKILLVTACSLVLSNCSEESADALPPFSTIEKATLGYANCVDQAARKLAAESAPAGDLAQQAAASCRELRDEALTLKSVPVFFPSVAEFDAEHAELARHTIESARRENVDAQY